VRRAGRRRPCGVPHRRPPWRISRRGGRPRSGEARMRLPGGRGSLGQQPRWWPCPCDGGGGELGQRGPLRHAWLGDHEGRVLLGAALQRQDVRLAASRERRTRPALTRSPLATRLRQRRTEPRTAASDDGGCLPRARLRFPKRGVPPRRGLPMRVIGRRRRFSTRSSRSIGDHSWRKRTQGTRADLACRASWWTKLRHS
jgi:hypothetical protein